MQQGSVNVKKMRLERGENIPKSSLIFKLNKWRLTSTTENETRHKTNKLRNMYKLVQHIHKYEH